MNKAKHLKPVDVYFEQLPTGGHIVWWNDPREKTPSMKYPALEAIFINIVEQFRYEGMKVHVNRLGTEALLEPTDSPKYQYSDGPNG